MTVFEALIVAISFSSLIVAVLSFYEQKRKRPFSNVQTGALRNEIKETRRGTSRC